MMRSDKKDWKILEIGAGTGIFTKYLYEYLQKDIDTERNYEVIALEPSDGFRSEMEQWSNSIEDGIVSVKTLKGLGASIPIADKCIDTIFIAQAFHWMANQATLKECHRVLKPGAPLVMIWNGYDHDIPWQSELEKGIIGDCYEEGIPRYFTGEWKQVFNEDNSQDHPLFTPLNGSFVKNAGKGSMTESSEPGVDRVLSTSVVVKKSQEEREHIADLVRQLLTKHGVPLETPLVYRTELAWTFAKPS